MVIRDRSAPKENEGIYITPCERVETKLVLNSLLTGAFEAVVSRFAGANLGDEPHDPNEVH